MREIYATTQQSEKRMRDIGLLDTAMGATVGLSAFASRFLFSNTSAEIFGGHYERSVVEHGFESLGMILFLSGLEMLANYVDEDEEENQFVYNGLKLFFILNLVGWEIYQSLSHERPIQVEQLVASALGLTFAFSIVKYQGRQSF